MKTAKTSPYFMPLPHAARMESGSPQVAECSVSRPGETHSRQPYRVATAQSLIFTGRECTIAGTSAAQPALLRRRRHCHSLATAPAHGPVSLLYSRPKWVENATV